VPADSGNKTLTLNLLRYLSERHACDVALLAEPTCDPTQLRRTLTHELPRLGEVHVFGKPRAVSLLVHRGLAALSGQHPALGRYERRCYPTCDAVCVVSPMDAAYLRALCPRADIHEIGIALPPAFTEAGIRQFPVSAPDQVRVLVAGAISHYGAAGSVADLL